MKNGTITSLFATVVAVFAAGLGLKARGEIKDHPYQVIIDRNPFGLRPIPPPIQTVTETNAPVEPPPDIKLTGITTLLGAPKVILQLEDKKTKKPSFPPPMAVGDSDPSGITVLAIDTENMKVRIKNGEAETTLDFKNNGVKAGAGAVASAAPLPGVVPLNPAAGVPSFNPAAPAAFQPNAGNTGRGILAGGTPTASVTPNNFNAAAANPYARTVRTDTDNRSVLAGGGNQVYNPNPQPVPTQPAYNRQEAEAIMEITRQKLQQQEQAGKVQPGQPPSILIPPTTLGNALNGSQTPAPNFPSPAKR